MARSRTTSLDPSLLEAALEGLELQKKRIEEQIHDVRRLLGKRGTAAKKPTAPAVPAAAPKKRELSPAARKRIAAAQKRRWANFRKGTTSEKES